MDVREASDNMLEGQASKEAVRDKERAKERMTGRGIDQSLCLTVQRAPSKAIRPGFSEGGRKALLSRSPRSDFI